MTSQSDAVQALASALRLDITPAKDGEGNFVLLSTASDRGLLVPARSTAAAARGALRLSNGLPPNRKLINLLAAAGLRTGVLQRTRGTHLNVASDSESVLAHLTEVMGKKVDFVISVGPQRPNRKPVIHMVDQSGHSVGFAKIGWNSLTSRLVEDEALFLPRLIGNTSLVVAPHLIHSGAWHDLRLAVISPLEPSWLALASAPVPGSPVIREIAGVQGAPISGSMEELGLLARLIGQMRELVDGPHEHVVDALHRMSEKYSAVEAATGMWHGDFAPWNVAPLGRGRFQVWDWERAGQRQVLGMDFLHYCFQGEYVSHRDIDKALNAAIAATRSEFLELNDLPSDLLVVLYLSERYARYWEAGTEGPRGQLESAIRGRLARVGGN